MNFADIILEISGVTIVDSQLWEPLYRVCERVRHLPHSVAECGVYRGGSLRLLARALPDKTVWGFDTFAGMPAEMVRDFDTHRAGDFGDTSYDQVAAFLRDLNNVRLVQGVFPESFAQVPPDEKFCLVHLDCDQYDSYHAALDFFLPRLVEGGFIVIDDYTHCEGARRAIDERFPRVGKPPYAIRKNGDFETEIFHKDINYYRNYCEVLNTEIQEKDQKIAESKRNLRETQRAIASLYASRSWRVTRPLRQIDAVIRKLRYLIVASAQRIYDATPLPPHIRTQITHFVFTYFGTFFKGTDPYKHWVDTINTGVAIDQSNLLPIETYYEKVPESVDKITGITFRNPEAPIVSIIIPIFNNWRYTYACLQAILERSGDDIPYEVIIADDGSTDDTHIMLDRIHGIHVLKNTSNLGLLRNCNNAVKHARGKFVVFLNNDTEVQSDWLNPLVNLFERFSNVGMVGGRLLYADGRVQEAGGIILQNGWGHPYGRGANPASYEFNYVREVDCLIGACLMVEKSVFLSLGGFDEAFAPAFYEEFDFAFTLRKHGYKIMYQPASSILHFESSSYGTELRDKQSKINHQKFCRKWQDVLTQQASSEDDLFLARDRSRGKKIILVIDENVPEYDQHAGGLTTYQYVGLFCDMGFKVIFLPDTLYPLAPYTAELQQLGVEVIYDGINIKEWLARYGKYLHYAWLARPNIASKYIDLLKNSTSSKILYYTHDLHYLRERRRYELDHNPLHLDESQRLEKLEFELFSRVDVILTPSNYEEHVIKENFPHKNVFTIPPHFYEFPPENDKPGVDFSQREGMLFLGGFNHLPNVDAVLWFVKEILPRVRELLPEVTFTVAGSHPSQEILALQNEGLRVTGYVPDLRPLFEKTRVFVAPLRYGAGVKGKIVSSMVYGVPVVTTSIGNEGLNLTDGQEALIADGPEAFAARTVELYTNQALWERLAHEAQTYVNRHFGAEKAQQLIQTVMGTMRVKEWVEKSRAAILPYSEEKPRFGTLEEELKELHLELTYACNLKCRMCDIWSKYSRDPKIARQEMSCEEIMEYVQQSKLLRDIDVLVLSGGEPFLKKGFAELAAYFLNNFPQANVGILSNFYNTQLIYNSLKEIQKKNGVQRLWIGTSLDGMEQLHDNTRGAPGAFRHFCETLQLMTMEFPTIPVSVNFTLTTDNYNDLFSVYHFCRTNNMAFSAQFPMPLKDAEIFTFAEKQMSEIEQQIFKIIEGKIIDFESGKFDENSLLAKIFYLHGMIDYQRNPRRVFKKCIGGRKFVTFSPEGKVYFCPILKRMVLGNLREQPFDEIWTGAAAGKLRKKIDQGFCDCWLNCTIYPNAGEALSGITRIVNSRQT
jgi:GT2 family glycosyltransferase/MoaA/NifB/PqqE/SkfB family radical SAM enzyme/glycosyltransferase involved in cell wall biosynthesis